MRALRFFLAVLLAASPVLAADRLTPEQSMRMAAMRVFNPSGPGQIGGGAHAFGPVSSVSYTGLGVGIFDQMLYRTTPLVSDSEATKATTALSGAAITTTGSVTAIPVTASNCSGVAAGQQLIDASVGKLIGVVSSCTLSPTTINLTAGNQNTIAASDVLVAQNTLPDACQGTFATRIRANFTSYFPSMYGGNFFINGNGYGGGWAELSNGLWMETDPAFRFNWHNPGNQSSTTNVPYLNYPAASFDAAAVDQWTHVVVSWNSCSSPTYSVLYMANEGGAWVRAQAQSGTTVYNANTSSPYQDNTNSNHNAFSFASDRFTGTPGYYFEADTEDDILDIGTSQGAIGMAVSNASCVGYNDGNPCISTAILNGYYNASTGKPARLNSTGTCSDWLGHQPTACLTTDGGGTYAPSVANFSTNQGYGGALVFSTYGASGHTIGPATLPVSGTAGPYQKWTIQGGGTGTATIYPIPSASPVGAHTYAAGDFMVAAVTQDSSTGTVACGTGWTTIWAGTNSSHNTSAICWRIATGNSSDTSAAITVSDTTTKWKSTLTDYQGVDTTSAGAKAIDAVVANNPNVASTSQTLPAVTTTHVNDLYVGFLFDQYTSSWSFNAPANLGVRANTGGTANPQLVQVDHAVPSIGAVVASTITVGVSLKYQGISIALKAAGSP